MKPIGPLMIEHRLIERLLGVLEHKLSEIVEKKQVDPVFIDIAVDFFRTYADRTHHGKEEDILFRELAKKQLSDEHKRIMNELVEEHIYARKNVTNLIKSNNDYRKKDKNALNDIIVALKELIRFYPAHIEKEDRHFFLPSMEYFSKEEEDEMLEEFWEFDKKMIHEKYRKIVEEFEQS